MNATLRFASLALVCALVPPLAGAQVFSEKPIQYIIPFPAGGESDVVARMQSDTSMRLYKQPMVVLNKPGAGGGVVWGQLNNYAPDASVMMPTGTLSSLWRLRAKR